MFHPTTVSSSAVQRRPTPFIGKLVYWLLGAPVAFLSVAYIGSLPLVLLGPFEERSRITNLGVSPYSAVVLVAATYVAWAFWRAVRGDPPAAAFRPFPWPVWAVATVLGLALGLVSFVRTA